MRKQTRNSSLSFILVLSLLCSIGIVLGKFLAFNITDFMRFSLENLTILFAAIAFGPISGFAVGIVQDLVGCLAVGYAINPIITLGSGLVGLTAGLAYSSLTVLPSTVKAALSIAAGHLIGSVIIKSVGLSVFYSYPLFITVAWRLFNYLIVGTVEGILIIYLTKSKLLLSKIQKIKPIPSNRKEKRTDDIQ